MIIISNKIGLKETSWTMIICGISPSVLFLTGYCSNQLMSGAFFSWLLCFFVSFIILYAFKRSLRKYACEKPFCDLIIEGFGKRIYCLFVVVTIIMIFLQGAISLSIYINSISNFVSEEIPGKSIGLILSLVIGICAYCGIEGVTRQGYVSAMVAVLFLGLMCYLAKKGVNTDNLYPVFGKSFKGSFLNPIYLILFSSLSPIFLISGMFKESEMELKCLKKVNVYVFSISFVLTALYVLTVPYPIGLNFGNSIDAVFLCIGSGEIIHRFEIFLLIFYLICAIQSLTFVICLCSEKLSAITNLHDYKPYVLVLSAMLYGISNFNISAYTYFIAGAFSAAIFLLYLVLIGIAGKIVHRKNEV